MFFTQHMLQKSTEKTLRSTNICKAAGMNDLSVGFLKDGLQVFIKPRSELCKPSIKLRSFPKSCRITKLKIYF